MWPAMLEKSKNNDILDRAIADLRRCHLNNRRRCRSTRRRRVSSEQSYDESSNKKASISYSSSLAAKLRQYEIYGIVQALKGKVGCLCPPGFCRCRMKTLLHDSNRDWMPMSYCKCPPGFVCRCQMKTILHNSNRASMQIFPCKCPPGFVCRCQIKTPVHNANRALKPMFPCKCPPGFACRCLQIQHEYYEDTQSCDESVGSSSPKSSFDQWNQSDEEIMSICDDAVENTVVANICPSSGIPPAIKDQSCQCNCPPGFCRCHSSRMF